MALTVVSPGAFQSSNVALQGNLVKISFPLAVDKNNPSTAITAITYQIRYTAQPIYIGGTATTSYIYRETTDQLTSSAWTTITNIVGEGALGTTRVTMPKFPTDMTIRYEIRALDDYNTSLSPVLTSAYYFIIKNDYPVLDALQANWSGTANNILITGSIRDTGFSFPANGTNTSSYTAAQWTAWRTGLSNIFGNILFTVQYRFGSSPTSLGAVTSTGAAFYLSGTNSRDWFRTPAFSFTITNTNNAFNPNNPYYFRLHLNKTGVTAASNATLLNAWNNDAHLITLLNQNPEFQIKKGTVKNNMPRADTARTGGGMFSHGASQIAQNSPERGHSIALYDHHVTTGSTTAANKPSIGFLNTAHAELAAIYYDGTNMKLRIRGGTEYTLNSTWAPVNHASTGTTYGQATGTLYGHVIGADNTSTADQRSYIPFRFINATTTINLNNQRTIADYYFLNPATSGNTNFPHDYGTINVANSPYLEVRRAGPSGFVTQRLTKRNTSNIWVRSSTSATAFSPWVSLTKSRRPASVIIGSAGAGHTANDCDYLCPGTAAGDITVINNAFASRVGIGGEIKFLRGTYYLNGNVTLNGGTNQPDLKITGEGDATKIVTNDRAIVRYITFSNWRTLTISSLRFNVVGFVFSSAVSRPRLENLLFDFLSISSSIRIVSVGVGAPIINGCYFYSPTVTTTTGPVAILLGASVTGSISSCYFEGGHRSIETTSGSVSISNCVFLNAYRPVYVGGPSTIIGNVFKSPARATVAITLNGSNFTVTGNTIENGQEAIYIGAYSNAVISGNNLYSNYGGNLIKFEGRNSNGVVIGNTINGGSVSLGIYSTVTYSTSWNWSWSGGNG